MALIRLLNGSFHYADTDCLLFEHLNLEIDTQWKGGIVARNGMGKSTLLKLIHQELELTQGVLIKEVETALFPITFVNRKQLVIDLMKQEIGPYEQCEQIMTDFTQGIATEEAYYEALSMYLEYDGYEIESKIKTC